jgi:uncharacterized protein YndB with AHSA1/START domain
MSINSEALVVQLERHINAAPENVWPVAVGKIDEWLGISLSAGEIGARMLIDVDMDNRYIMYGNITEYDEPRKLAFTWNELDVSKRAVTTWDSRVTLTFEPRDGGTLVTLTHTGFDHLPDAGTQYANYKMGWESLNDLEKLAQMCEGQ